MRLVFITYLNRSGSTYLANLLSCSPGICVCPESDILVRLFLEDPAANLLSKPGSVQRVMDAIEEDKKTVQWEFDAGLGSCLEDAGSNLGSLIRILGYYRDREKPGAETVVFKAERIAALIGRIMHQGNIMPYVEISFISMVRDPRGVIASQLRTTIPGTDLRMASSPVRASIFWKENIRHIRKFGNDSSNQLVVKYEELLENPAGVLGKLGAFIGHDLAGSDPSRGDLLKKLSEEYRKIHSLAGQAPQKDRSDAWNTELGRNEVILIERVCGAEMKEFGYFPGGESLSLSAYLYLCRETMFYFIRKIILKVKSKIG